VVYRRGKELSDLGELRKSIGWVTSTLASQIPPREKTLRTVVSGKFAQIGLVEGPWGKPSPRDYARARAYLEQMGCLHLADHEFGTLSQGEQQKVLIARARMTKPYLLFLDEPCAGMDPGAREIFLGGLARLGREKRVPTLIYVTHHIEEILPLFKKTLILKEGRVLEAGSTRGLLKRDVLERLYRVSLTIRHRKGRYWPIVK
jgi:iron complex transport system ATP-binding protein